MQAHARWPRRRSLTRKNSTSPKPSSSERRISGSTWEPIPLSVGPGSKGVGVAVSAWPAPETEREAFSDLRYL